ncbi:MAG: porin family protein [Thermoanaerobaculales bacterium]|jgi:hypothetical protein|nr:porin family protein [Thermoanaerobaculales bacterium]
MGRTTGTAAVAMAVAMAALTASPAGAESGLYLGASVGRTTLAIDDVDLDLESFDFEADDTAYKVIVGYRLLGFLAVEGSYIDFGSLSDSIDTIEGTASLEAELTGFDAVAMGMLPLGIADLFVKAGVVVWDADLRSALGELSVEESDSGTDLVYGAGAQVRFKGLAVRAEIEFFDVADADNLYLITVGATYTF